MQPSQRAATPSASAISSLVFLSSAPSRVAACASAAKPCMVSGMSLRNFFRLAEMSLVSSEKSLLIGLVSCLEGIVGCRNARKLRQAAEKSGEPHAGKHCSDKDEG